ncbi:Ubiquinone biosynthesis O-methyltransferase [Schistosoma japonicum]|nr:Ubiquinone biosynthesis O-methyltransferase [Schistosoma japonicum]
MEGQQHLMNYEQFIVTDQLNTTNDNTKHIDPCQPMFSQRVEENNNLARLNECLKQFDQSMNYIGNKFTQFGSLLNTYLTASTSKSSGCAESDLQTSFDALMKHFQTVFKQINHMRSQVEEERNANIVRLRSISSLKSTLEEAESQLEQSQKLECEVHHLRECNKLITERLYSYKRNHCLSKSTQVDLLDYMSVSKTLNTDSHVQHCSNHKASRHADTFQPNSAAQRKIIESTFMFSDESQAYTLAKCSELQFGTQSKPLNNDELSLVGDFESQLIACSRIASILYDRLSTDIFQHGELLNNLKECSDSFSVTLLTLSQFHSDPGVLEVYSSITSTYDHIKHIQSLLLSREQDASDTLKLTYAFQQKLEHITACKTETQNTLKNTKHNSVQTDFLTNNEQSNQQISNSKLNGFKNASEVKYETLLKYGLVNPRNVLNRTSKHSGCFESHKPTKSELQEALLNALCQLDRLKKYRLTQKTRIDQLQERLDHMGSELDSSVDTIRHHQTNYEAQKRRTAMEINHLRNQLAKTTVLLDQFKLFFSKANLNTTSLNQNIRVLIPSLLKSIHTNNELQDVDALSIDELKLKLHVTQNELDQLRLDMVHQREDGDREASKLRGQLAEVSSDARALRIQLNRLISQGISSSKLNGLESTNSSDSSSCINCQKLQRLNDVLQRKQSKMNSFPDLINHQGNVMNHENFVCENSAFTQKVTHRENVVSSSVQTDLLSAIPTTNCIQKVDVATDPTNEYTNILPHLPISKCECIQTESLLMGNDIMPSETSLAGEISLISEIIRYGDVGEPICLNESQLHSSHVSSKHAEVSLRKSDEATINDHRNSSTDFKSIYNVNGSQNVSEESFHSQLLHRLKGAEEEAIMAMDQLRASNAEFLTLKERLSHATVERAHLKATIEGLDEQVALLEDSLYERTQELHKYQMLLGEYCPTYQKQISPHSVISEVS